MAEKYITVAEFAEQQGLSRQAVYQQISKGTLKQFVKIIDKRKYIDIEAFSSVVCKADCKAAVNQIDNNVDKEIDNSLQAILEAKNAHIKSLEQQLQEARNEIQFLQKHITEQADIINKQLHLQAHTQQLLGDEQPGTQPGEQPAAPEPVIVAAAPQKRSLFSRIFKK